MEGREEGKNVKMVQATGSECRQMIIWTVSFALVHHLMIYSRESSIFITLQKNFTFILDRWCKKKKNTLTSTDQWCVVAYFFGNHSLGPFSANGMKITFPFRNNNDGPMPIMMSMLRFDRAPEPANTAIVVDLMMSTFRSGSKGNSSEFWWWKCVNTGRVECQFDMLDRSSFYH